MVNPKFKFIVPFSKDYSIFVIFNDEKRRVFLHTKSRHLSLGDEKKLSNRSLSYAESHALQYKIDCLERSILSRINMAKGTEKEFNDFCIDFFGKMNGFKNVTISGHAFYAEFEKYYIKGFIQKEIKISFYNIKYESK